MNTTSLNTSFFKRIKASQTKRATHIVIPSMPNQPLYRANHALLEALRAAEELVKEATRGRGLRNHRAN